MSEESLLEQYNTIRNALKGTLQELTPPGIDMSLQYEALDILYKDAVEFQMCKLVNRYRKECKNCVVK